MVRLFMGLRLPDAMREALNAAQRAILRRDRGGYWRPVPPENLHLSLVFIGDTTAEAVPSFSDAMRTAAQRCEPFEWAVEGWGVFGRPERPRVWWAGVRSSVALVKLQESLALACADCGLASDDRPFRPHITLARARRGSRRVSTGFEEAIAPGASPVAFGHLGAQEVILWRSHLGPNGARYEALATASIGSRHTRVSDASGAAEPQP